MYPVCYRIVPPQAKRGTVAGPVFRQEIVSLHDPNGEMNSSFKENWRSSATLLSSRIPPHQSKRTGTT